MGFHPAINRVIEYFASWIVGSSAVPCGFRCSAQHLLPRTDAEATAADNRERNSLRQWPGRYDSPLSSLCLPLDVLRFCQTARPNERSYPLDCILPFWNRPLMARSQVTSFQIGCSGPQ